MTPLCSVPQRNAGTSRTTRFTLSMGGLVVASSTSLVNFIFTECIASLQPRVPAHFVVLDVSGYGASEAPTALCAAIAFLLFGQGLYPQRCTLPRFCLPLSNLQQPPSLAHA